MWKQTIRIKILMEHILRSSRVIYRNRELQVRRAPKIPWHTVHITATDYEKKVMKVKDDELGNVGVNGTEWKLMNFVAKYFRKLLQEKSN